MKPIRNENIMGQIKCGGNRKESPGKEVEVVCACDAKRGALYPWRNHVASFALRFA